MQLPGQLAASTLGDLLGALHRERITGQLELIERRGPSGAGVAGRRHCVHLSSGLVTLVESELPVTPLGEILQREGLVGARAVLWALGRIKAGDSRASGEILVSAGLARAEFIRAALRKQIQQRLDGLFALEDALITFHAARPVRGFAVKVSPLWPMDFLHGRARARDRAPRPSVRATTRPSPSPRPEAPPPRARPREVLGADERARARRLLGIDEGASAAEVRRAFRRLAALLHPDRCASAPTEEQQRSAARFARLSAAYHLLVG